MTKNLLRLALALTVLPALAGTAGAQGTPEQRSACTPEVFRLCDTDIPNVESITACLAKKRVKLTPACRAAMAPSLPPEEPAVQTAAAKPAARKAPTKRAASAPKPAKVPVSASAEPTPAPTR